MKGSDPPKIVSVTIIGHEVFLNCVEWITGTFQFLPGKIRNFRIDGQIIRNLPVFVRNGPKERCFDMYKATLTAKQLTPMGRDLFYRVLNALTMTGVSNAALSYYYVNHIDLVAELREMMASIAERVSEHTAALRTAIEDLGLKLKFATYYLKYSLQYEMVESGTDGWLCATFALGGVCDHTHTFDDKAPLSQVLTIDTSIHELAKTLRGIPSSQRENVTEDEIESIDRMAELTHKEFFHYAKHLVRDWWQSKYINEKKLALGANEAMLIIDHKQKILPKRQNEAQSEYFGKAGMSLCGAMLIFKNDAGEFEHLFYDVIMKNVNSQRAEDLLPVLEVVLREIKKSTNITHVSLVSDNASAFTSYGHIPFVYAVNCSDDFCSIKRWIFNEPQCGKSMLDTHFAFVNIQLKRALLDEKDYTNQIELYEALSHDGGIRGTTVLLVSELVIVTNVAQSCSQLIKKVKLDIGVRSAHEFDFTTPGKITIHHQAGLTPKGTINLTTSNWPKTFDNTGTLEQISRSADRRPIKTKKKDDNKEYVPGETGDTPNTFANALRNAVREHLPSIGTSTVAPIDTSQGANPTESDAFIITHAFMTQHYAKKANKDWIKLDKSIQEKLQALFNQGVGIHGKKNRVSAEVATRLLKMGALKDTWDQRYMCSVTKVKSLYSLLNKQLTAQMETMEASKSSAQPNAASSTSAPPPEQPPTIPPPQQPPTIPPPQQPPTIPPPQQPPTISPSTLIEEIFEENDTFESDEDYGFDLSYGLASVHIAEVNDDITDIA
jgi:hypothetical protein